MFFVKVNSGSVNDSLCAFARGAEVQCYTVPLAGDLNCDTCVCVCVCVCVFIFGGLLCYTGLPF